MPPWKQYSGTVGSEVDNLRYFVVKLFGLDGGNQQAFRDQFFTLTGPHAEQHLRELLADNEIIIPATDGAGNPIRIALMDVQNCRFKVYGNFDPTTELFYLLVMPPVPTTYDADMQAWESAWYHAIVDGFGM